MLVSGGGWESVLATGAFQRSCTPNIPGCWMVGANGPAPHSWEPYKTLCLCALSNITNTQTRTPHVHARTVRAPTPTRLRSTLHTPTGAPRPWGVGGGVVFLCVWTVLVCLHACACLWGELLAATKGQEMTWIHSAATEAPHTRSFRHKLDSVTHRHTHTQRDRHTHAQRKEQTTGSSSSSTT